MNKYHLLLAGIGMLYSLHTTAQYNQETKISKGYYAMGHYAKKLAGQRSGRGFSIQTGPPQKGYYTIGNKGLLLYNAVMIQAQPSNSPSAPPKGYYTIRKKQTIQ